MTIGGRRARIEGRIASTSYLGEKRTSCNHGPSWGYFTKTAVHLFRLHSQSYCYSLRDVHRRNFRQLKQEIHSIEITLCPSRHFV